MNFKGISVLTDFSSLLSFPPFQVNCFHSDQLQILVNAGMSWMEFNSANYWLQVVWYLSLGYGNISLILQSVTKEGWKFWVPWLASTCLHWQTIPHPAPCIKSMAVIWVFCIGKNHHYAIYRQNGLLYLLCLNFLDANLPFLQGTTLGNNCSRIRWLHSPSYPFCPHPSQQ